jgi:hypothetical protein
MSSDAGSKRSLGEKLRARTAILLYQGNAPEEWNQIRDYCMVGGLGRRSFASPRSLGALCAADRGVSDGDHAFAAGQCVSLRAT